MLNDAVLRFVGESTGDRDLAVLHVVGERFVDEHRAAGGLDRDGSDGVWYRVVGYEERMSAVYSACDLMIGRGGAGTVADVVTTGVPSILVPWSGAVDDHQRANVMWLSGDGAAILLEESDVDSRLSILIAEVRSDPTRLSSMAEIARALGESNRRGAIADLIEEVAGARR
jgi:UDP-N-acetylglucosamine--N-acetylmuramyl-(pentapeptide) pyrophosphoryl-undecaprenol N-acetylglucosamine transferase